MRNRIKIYTSIMAAFLWLVACDEAKRYEISGNDNIPPGTPVFIDSKPLPGGARIFFRPPADEDLLSIEVSYRNAAGKDVRFSASFFTDSLDIFGFGSEGEHAIDIYAVDRAGNRSKKTRTTVVSLEPPVVSVAKMVQVQSSFASMLLKWTNEFEVPVYVSVDFSYTQNGTRQNHTTEFATHLSETRSIDGINLYNDEQVSVKVNVSDKYENVVHAKDTTIMLLVDGIISKEQWSLPDPGTDIGGVNQAISTNDTNLENVIDGLNDTEVAKNIFETEMTNPWSIIIDLGDEYELSRIVTHQRQSGSSDGSVWGVLTQGFLYQGDNVLAFNLYVWDETILEWELVSRYNIRAPVVNSAAEYVMLGIKGDMTFLYPEEPKFSKPTRLIRYEAIRGKYISEITLYGRNAR